MKKASKMMCMMAAVAMSFMSLSGCGKNETGSGDQTFITVKGSDTMAHLTASWAEAFGDVNKGIDVSFTGGGSGTGIASIMNGTTDICASSRDARATEIQQAKGLGIDMIEIVVGLDGIAVVVNPSNPVEEMTIEQIGKIYTGATGNWSEVGGENMPIQILSRESSSGTYAFFQEAVLNKKDYARTARLMPSTSAIVQSVAQDKGAIGYVGLGYAMANTDKVKIVKVKMNANSPAVFPTPAAIISKDYPIARGLNFYTNGQPSGNIKKFIDFCLSPKGQKIVTETGYVPVVN